MMNEISDSNLNFIYLRKGIDNERKYKCAFLDRDGVLIKDPGYVGTIDRVKVIEESFNMIRKLKDNNFLIGVVTNQSGLGRGYFSRNSFIKTQTFINQQFKINDAEIDFLLACPYHIDAKTPYNVEHDFRKPNIGMIREIQKYLDIDLDKSFMIGDKVSDMEFAENANLGQKFFFYNKTLHRNLSEAEYIYVNKKYIIINNLNSIFEYGI